MGVRWTRAGRAVAGSPKRRLALTAKVGSARRDVIVFSGAIGTLALHAAVDAFVAPDPGTGAGDHLLRGLATFAVLAAIALSYARLPASAEPLAAAFAPTLIRRNEPELVLEG